MVTRDQNDIIRDIIRRIQSAEESGQRRLDADLARQVEIETRQLWGGCKIHVAVGLAATLLVFSAGCRRAQTEAGTGAAGKLPPPTLS